MNQRAKWLGAFIAVFVIIGALKMTDTIIELNNAVEDLAGDVITNQEMANCVLYQFALHRQDNQESHNALREFAALLSQTELEVEHPPVPGIPEALDKACDPFLPSPGDTKVTTPEPQSLRFPSGTTTETRQE